MNSKVVYLHRKATDLSIFYVGMGSVKRSKTIHGRNNHWYNLVNKHNFFVDIIAEGLSVSEALELEEFVISTIGLNNLSNCSTGGDYPRFNEEHLRRMSELRKGRNFRSKEAIEKSVKTFKSNKEWISELSKRTKNRNKNNNPSIKYKVMCVNDNNTFNSIRSASRYYGIDNSYLSKHIRGYYDNVKGLVFKKIN